MAFEETTSGHASQSISISLKAAGFSGGGTPSGALVTNWTQMVWDPADFAVEGIAPISRTFELGYINGSNRLRRHRFERREHLLHRRV
jgi:hypothetical protein